MKARDYKDATDLVAEPAAPPLSAPTTAADSADRAPRGGSSPSRSASFDGDDVAATLDIGGPRNADQQIFSQKGGSPESPPEIVTMAKEIYNAGVRRAGGLGIGTDGAAPCLRADDHPAAVAIGVDPYNQATTGGAAMTIRAGTMSATGAACVIVGRGGCAVFENHAQDSRVREMPDVSPTQGAQLCNAPANNPLVVTGLDLYNQAETGGAAMAVRAAASDAEHIPCIALEGNGSRPSHMGDGYSAGGASFTLNTIEHRAVAVRTAQTCANGCGISAEVAHTLDRADGRAVAAPCGDYVVRRLTPRECERLQGFPDDWTRIPYRGRPAEECPDGPRYKAMGNSWGTNCAEWILRRLLAARPVWHRDGQDD